MSYYDGLTEKLEQSSQNLDEEGMGSMVAPRWFVVPVGCCLVVTGVSRPRKQQTKRQSKGVIGTGTQ